MSAQVDNATPDGRSRVHDADAREPNPLQLTLHEEPRQLTLHEEPRQLTLHEGMVIPFGGNRFSVVDASLASRFHPGDRLYVAPYSGALLHVPADIHALVTSCVDSAVAAGDALRRARVSNVQGFYRTFARRLMESWGDIAAANAADVERARDHGRSTTRLAVTESVRDDMVAGLNAWAAALEGVDKLGTRRVRRVEHGDWNVEVRTAPLGVIGFVFEGRPNVFADATGVLASGNTAVLRIGGDALSTAEAIMSHALRPALAQEGLPEDAVALIPSRERSAGWALFSDSRLALAVVRGSGRAVTELSGVAQQAGVAVSAHGTGGAWMYADRTADAMRFAAAVEHSLDRKVCNTLNVVLVARERAAELVPLLLRAADRAAAGRGGTRARVHVETASRKWIDEAEWQLSIDVARADGACREPRVSMIRADQLGTEWEWETVPEISVAVVDDLEAAAALFNAHSPRFIATIICEDTDALEDFRDRVDAPFFGDGFTRWVDGQYALNETELGLSSWQNGRLLGRAGILTGADLTSQRIHAHHKSAGQHR